VKSTTFAAMKIIDVATWERREHFHFFQNRERPQFSITFNLDITDLIERKAQLDAEHGGLRLTDFLYFLVSKTMNAIPEFKTRIVDGNIVEFETVDLAFTHIPKGRKLHANCVLRHADSFGGCIENINAARAEADARPTLTPAGGGGQDMVYVSVIPGISFTAVTNPWGDPRSDTVPRIILGGVFASNGRKHLPVSIEALHSFIDGVHMTRFQAICSDFIKDSRAFFVL
jgi:chloramphenicol O-acetyltransferase type A